MKVGKIFISAGVTLLAGTHLVTAACKQVPFHLYIKEQKVPQPVLELSQKGTQYLTSVQKGSPDFRATYDAIAGGRKDGWIERTFGEKESKLVASLQGVPFNDVWTVEEIDAAFNLCKIEQKNCVRPMKVHVVQGVGVNGIALAVSGDNAVVQFASQFNGLESPSSHPSGPTSMI